jgi:vacuolar-type H+-ATPase subunit I/STV1
MSEKDNTILESIDQILDKTDPVQKAIALLASLIDIRMRQFSSENSEQHTHLLDKINEVSKDQEDYEKRLNSAEHIANCPLGNDKDLEELKKQLQPYLFINNYPKLALLMLIGVLALCGLGVDKITEFFK